MYMLYILGIICLCNYVYLTYGEQPDLDLNEDIPKQYVRIKMKAINYLYGIAYLFFAILITIAIIILESKGL